MTREEEIEFAWFNKEVQSNHRYDEKSFKEGAKWADKTMIEKISIWVTERYDLDYMGDFKDLLDYLKSLKEE